MLMIKDREGFISAKLARHYFERAVRENTFLATPLDCTVGADGLVEYADPETHAMWVGWALGMRCQQRIEAEMDERCPKHAPPPERSVADIPDEELLRRVVRSLARNRPRRKEFAWAAIHEAFWLGSTYSMQLCRRFGLDPDTGAELKTPNVS